MFHPFIDITLAFLYDTTYFFKPKGGKFRLLECSLINSQFTFQIFSVRFVCVGSMRVALESPIEHCQRSMSATCVKTPQVS